MPYYDPSVVFGPWPYPAYPPFYFPPPFGYVAGGLLATGIAFGAGYAVGRWASGGNYWGGGFGWGGNNINVNRNININNVNVNNNWRFNPDHRRGVPYANGNVQNRYGNSAIRNGAQNRMDFRGRAGNQVLQPGSGGNRPNLGGGAGTNRPDIGAGNRPNLGGGTNRPGERPAAADQVGLLAAAGPATWLAAVGQAALQVEFHDRDATRP